MTYKSNVNTNARNFYVLLGGNDDQAGLSEETARATINSAVASVNALVPPPSGTDPAAILVRGAGLFTENVTIPDNTNYESLSATLVVDNAAANGLNLGFNTNTTINQVFGGDALTALINATDVSFGTLNCSSIAIGNASTVGLGINGATSQSQFTINTINVFATGSTAVLDQATTTSITVEVSQILLNATNTTGITCNAQIVAGSPTYSIDFIGANAPVSGTVGINVVNGNPSVHVESISAETAITVATGNTLNLISSDISGTIQVAAGATLNCEITNFTGTLLNSGTINGRIGDQIFGSTTFSDNVVIQGDLLVNGTLTAINTEDLFVSNNNILLNSGYTNTVLQNGGLVVNHGSSGTSDTVVAGAFVAGVNGVSNPTVTTVGAATFAANDFILIEGTNLEENDGLYEVLSHAANVLTVRGVGITDTQEFFTKRDFVANASDNATIINADVGVIRSDTVGNFEIAQGTVTPLNYITLGTGDGDVTGPVSSVDNELALFDGITGIVIQGGSQITATPGTGAALDFGATLVTDTPGFTISDNAASAQLTVNYDISNTVVNVQTPQNIAITATNGLAFTSSASSFAATGFDPHELTVSTDSSAVVSLTSTGLDGDTIGLWVTSSDPEGTITAATGDYVFYPQGISRYVGALPNDFVKVLFGDNQNTVDNALAIWDGANSNSIKAFNNATFDGNIVQIDQVAGTEDVGIRLRNQAASTLTELFWDDSNIRAFLNVTGNFTIDSSVQLAISGGAETNLTAGLNLGLTSTTGTFVTTSIADQFPLSIVNAGTGGARVDVYTRNSSPEGALSADFGYSYCLVRDSVTPDDNGLWLLNTNLNNQNTPWVQIASTTHTQNAVTSITDPSTNFALAAYSGITGQVIQQSGTTTDSDGNLVLTAPAALNIGFTFQDAAQSNPAQLTYNDNTKGIFLDAPFGALTIDAGNDISIESSTGDVNITANGELNIVSAVADTVATYTVESQGTNGANYNVHVGTRNPKNNIVPLALGDHYIRAAASASNSNYFIADDSTNTGWTALKGGGIYLWGNSGVNSGTTTRYLDPSFNSGNNAGTNEDNTRLYIATGGHFRDFRVSHAEPAGNGNLIEYTFAVNGTTDGSTTVTLASTGLTAGNTAFVKVERGDYITVHITKVSGVGSSPNGVKYEASFFPDGS